MEVLKLLLIFGFYQAFILSVLMLIKREKQASDYALSLVFFVFATTVLLAFGEIYNRQNGYPFPWIIHTASPLILLHGPVIWLYVQTLTRRKFQLKWHYLLHFLPFFMVIILLRVSTLGQSVEARIAFEQSETFTRHISFPIVIIMIAIFTQGYFIQGLLLVKRYRRKVENYFSDISRIELMWLRVYLISCIIFYAGASLLYITDYVFDYISYPFLQAIGFSYATLLIFVLGYFGYKQGNVFTSSKVDYSSMINDNEVFPSDTETSYPNDFERRLKSLMENSKPYTNSELTLAGLANLISVSPAYLSNYLNTHLNQSFFDFVNGYRVNEFKRLCGDDRLKEITIIGLAWDAGFNSKATFNRVFKRITGMTPGDYIRTLNK